MIALSSQKRSAVGLEKRALNQAAREIMLAQSSDWGFLINTRQAIQYSEMRIVRHIQWAKKLLKQVEKGSIDRGFLSTLEYIYNIFKKDMDFRIFSKE